GSAWLAVVVALNAVVGLAYYVRVAAVLYASPGSAVPDAFPGSPVSPAGPAVPRPAVPWAVAVALFGLTAVALVVGFAPQLVLDAADLAAGLVTGAARP